MDLPLPTGRRAGNKMAGSRAGISVHLRFYLQMKKTLNRELCEFLELNTHDFAENSGPF
jgi:hypothetical protein